MIEQTFVPVILNSNQILGQVPLDAPTLFEGTETEVEISSGTYSLTKISYIRTSDGVPVEFMAIPVTQTQVDNRDHLNYPGYESVELTTPLISWIFNIPQPLKNSWSTLQTFLEKPTYVSPETPGFLFFDEESYLSIPGSTDFAFGTGDFTIRWKQFKTNPSGNTRLFSVGAWPTASIAVSQEISEGNSFIFWINNTVYSPVESVDFNNAYREFEVSRASGTLRIFQDGSKIFEEADVTGDITDDTTPLLIGLEAVGDIAGGIAFGGWLHEFHIIKGTALHTANYEPTGLPDELHADSVLYLKAPNAANAFVDFSPSEHVVTNNGVTWTSTYD